MKKPKQKQAIKYVIYISILVLSAALAIWLIMGNKSNFDETMKIIGKSNPILILLMLMLMVVIYIIEGLVLTIFARLNEKKYRWKQGTYNGLIGVFFNGITPSASGGQFVQAYTFSKQGIPISRSASILLMHFITYQIAMVLFCLITLSANFSAAFHAVTWGKMNVIHLSILGFSINAAVIAGLYFVAYSKLFQRFITIHLINFLSKIKIVRKKEKLQAKLDLQIRNFRIEATKLNKNWRVLIIVVALHIVKFLILYSIPFFAMRAVGIEIASDKIFLIICFASFVYLITSFFPLPGASGGAEFIFTTFFSAFFVYSGNIPPDLSAMMLIWRFVTFYFGLVIGGLTFFFYRESGKSEIKKVDDPILYYETAKLSKVLAESEGPKVIFKEASQEEQPEKPKND